MFVSFVVSVLGLKKRCELLLVFVCVKKGTSLRCGGRRDVDVFFPKNKAYVLAIVDCLLRLSGDGRVGLVVSVFDWYD